MTESTANDSWEREVALKEELMKRVGELLLAKGIKMSTGACGCCDGVCFDLEIDGKIVVKDATNWNFSNF